MAQHGATTKDDRDKFERAGFYGQVYENKKTGEIVIAYRQSGNLLSDPMEQRWRNDWDRTNLPQTVGVTTDQYVAAMELAKAAREKYGNRPITLTGFSKGGGQASYAGSVADKVVTFNGARNPDAADGASRDQINVIVPGDIVGDPDTYIGAGIGRLPGENVTVQSSQPRLIGDVNFGPEKHSMDGMLGGLLDAAGGKYRVSSP